MFLSLYLSGEIILTCFHFIISCKGKQRRHPKKVMYYSVTALVFKQIFKNINLSVAIPIMSVIQKIKQLIATGLSLQTEVIVMACNQQFDQCLTFTVQEKHTMLVSY